MQCCGSGMFIPDPKTATKERNEKKLVVITFFGATNFTKLKIILFLKCWRKKFGPVFKELYVELFTQNLSLSSQKYGFGIRDPRSGIRKKPYYGSRIPDPGPGVKKAPDPGSGSATLIKCRLSYFHSSSTHSLPEEGLNYAIKAVPVKYRLPAKV